MQNYKTFEDLDFHPWLDGRATFSIIPAYAEALQARLDFPNGYGVSVLFGEAFYSNGEDTYELAVIKDGDLVYPPEVCPDVDVLGYITKDEVTEAMRKIQDL